MNHLVRTMLPLRLAFERFRFGLQYSYFEKDGWSGNNSAAGTSTKAGFAPKAIDNMIWTSIRYYIP